MDESPRPERKSVRDAGIRVCAQFVDGPYRASQPVFLADTYASRAIDGMTFLEAH